MQFPTEGWFITNIPTILRSGVRKMMPKRVKSWVFIKIIILSLMKGWPNANVAKA